MRNDAFWRQHETKVLNRRKILATIAEKPSTFSELLQSDAIGLSRPILTKYLRELENEAMIERNIAGKRIEYQLTERGRGSEELRKEFLATVFRMMEVVSGDYEGSKAISELAKVAQVDPALVDGFMQWLQEFMPILASDDMLRWMRKYPKDERKRLLMRELKPTEKPAELLTSLHNLLNAMREVLTTHKARKS